MLTTLIALIAVTVIEFAVIVAMLVKLDRLAAVQRSHVEHLASLETSVRNTSDYVWRHDLRLSDLDSRVEELSDRNGLAKLAKAASEKGCAV